MNYPTFEEQDLLADFVCGKLQQGSEEHKRASELITTNPRALECFNDLLYLREVGYTDLKKSLNEMTERLSKLVGFKIR